MSTFVTKSFIPNIDEYFEYIKDIFKSGCFTNNGKHLRLLESELGKTLNIKNVQCLANGTLALQIGLQALDIENCEVITTPFSYVATTTSILWQKCKPVFCDINLEDFNINTEKIEEKITSKTRAIMPVHVFGYPCDIDKIKDIAARNNLKVIYDGAHAFGSKYKGKSLLSYGDITACSFHATKLFHTVEGGACFTNNKELSAKIELLKQFGHRDDKYYSMGINAKMSELHAAMGLAILPHIRQNIEKRREISEFYDQNLKNLVQRPLKKRDLEYNYAYYPVVFETEQKLLNTLELLNKNEIFPRRYFNPSLNLLPYLKNTSNCPVSESVAKRILCLPLYENLELQTVANIISLIKEAV